MYPDSKNMAVDLSGRFSIVTGAGSGIGRAIAMTLADAGAKVAVIDLDAGLADETVTLIERRGGSAIAIGADITNEERVEAVIAELVTAWGQIDVLCNNAGITDFMVPPSVMPTEVWNRVIGVNLTGQFFVTRAVLKHMLSRKLGSITNIVSPAGLRGAAAGLAYTASKHGMVGFTRHIAWFHAADGIRCNGIAPGSTATNIDRGQGLAAFDPVGVERLMPVLATSGPPAPAQTVANVALFLASDAAMHVNGIIMPVDGGWMAG